MVVASDYSGSGASGERCAPDEHPRAVEHQAAATQAGEAWLSLGEQDEGAVVRAPATVSRRPAIGLRRPSISWRTPPWPAAQAG